MSIALTSVVFARNGYEFEGYPSASADAESGTKAGDVTLSTASA